MLVYNWTNTIKHSYFYFSLAETECRFYDIYLIICYAGHQWISANFAGIEMHYKTIYNKNPICFSENLSF